MKKILVLAQVIPQWYVDVLTKAFGEESTITFITGSEVEADIIICPKHDPRSLKSRMICWMKYGHFVSKWARKNADKEYSCILAVSNPPINSYVGLKLAKRFKAAFVYVNWDIYPDVIERSISNPIAQFVCKLWHGWNRKNYSKIDRIVTIGDIMSEAILKDMPLNSNITVIPVASDVENLKPVSKEQNLFLKKNGLTDKFIILYSGKMGFGHNIEIILQASEQLMEYKDIAFVFIGEGPKYSLVQEYIENKSSKNVFLFPLQDKEMFPFSIASGDIGIVTQEEKMADLFMPSKTYSMMACGEAIISVSTKKDDLTALVEKKNIGECVTSDNAKDLSDKILYLYKNKGILEEYKKKSRTVAESEYGMDFIVSKYKELIDETAIN